MHREIESVFYLRRVSFQRVSRVNPVESRDMRLDLTELGQNVPIFTIRSTTGLIMFTRNSQTRWNTTRSTTCVHTGDCASFTTVWATTYLLNRGIGTVVHGAQPVQRVTRIERDWSRGRVIVQVTPVQFHDRGSGTLLPPHVVAAIGIAVSIVDVAAVLKHLDVRSTMPTRKPVPCSVGNHVLQPAVLLTTRSFYENPSDTILFFSQLPRYALGVYVAYQSRSTITSDVRDPQPAVGKFQLSSIWWVIFSKRTQTLRAIVSLYNRQKKKK